MASTGIDHGGHAAVEPLPLRRRLAGGLGRFLRHYLPKRLFPRSLLIVVLPMIVLQSIVAYVFMERHWQLVTRRLSEGTTRDIAALIAVLESYPQDPDYRTFSRIASDQLGLNAAVLPHEPLPPPADKPFFSLLDRTLSRLISQEIGKPFWIDTVGRSDFVEIRIDLGDKILRVFARRSQTYASNAHIFLVWMVAASLVLIAIALLFLRNQIKPITALAEAAESFGKGRPVEGFRPRGALEVRQAAHAFFEMRRRIERQIEQRTAMLAGVSHDLRTILTRFRLELAFLGDGPEVAALKQDVDDMQGMLEAYLAFARGDGDEQPAAIDLAALLEELAAATRRDGATVTVAFEGEPVAIVKPNAFRRAILNLVANAARHGRTVAISGRHADGWVTVAVEDDGPGIPEEMREAVFRPFFRFDAARNQDESGTGLGLTIARDVIRGHGGEIALGRATLGGLRAQARIPG
jgi:two-component system osmolarity sensor histidine kinase EnvZ